MDEKQIIIIEKKSFNDDFVNKAIDLNLFQLDFVDYNKKIFLTLEKLYIKLKLIIIDINEITDDFSIIKKIYQDDRYSNIPIMYVVDRYDNLSVLKCYGMGGVDFIERPINSLELKNKINILVKQHEEYQQSGYASFKDFSLYHRSKKIIFYSEFSNCSKEIILYLEGKLKVDILEVQSYDHLYESLTVANQAHMLICENIKIFQLEMIAKKINECKLNILIVVLDTKDDEEDIKRLSLIKKLPQALYLKGLEFRRLEEIIYYLFNKYYSLDLNSISRESDYQEFVKVRDYHFYHLDEASCDIYLRLGSNKYLKVMNKGDIISEDQIAQLKKIHCSFFYVKEDDFKKLVEDIYQHILVDLTSSDSKETQENNILMTNEIVKEMIRSLGVSEKVIELSDEAIKKTFELVEDNNELKKMLKEGLINSFSKEKESIFLSYISCGLASIIEETAPFGSDSFVKMCMASFFHDITLEEDEFDLVGHYRQIEKNRNPRDLKRINQFKRHPLESSKVLKKVEESSKDVDDMIIHHHEHPAGSGFPYGIKGNQIPLFSSIFILSHEFIYRFYESERNKYKIPLIIKEMADDYKHKSFSKALKALDHLFK